jgi:hypothetical protein
MTADRFGIANVAPISKIICASKMERWDWLFSFQLSNFVLPSMFAEKFGLFRFPPSSSQRLLYHWLRGWDGQMLTIAPETKSVYDLVF